MSILVYGAAALAEIAGCFAFWAWLRLDKLRGGSFPEPLRYTCSPISRRSSRPSARGRTYAAYGGTHILSALPWFWAAERVRPDRWDVAGVGNCLTGAAIILWGPRPA